MKTVLITIPWFCPAYKAGGPIQSIASLVAQPLEGVQYRIVCGNTDLDGTTLDGIETGKWVTYNQRTEVWYAGEKNRTGSLVRALQTVDPDLLYIVGIYDWHFNIIPLFIGRGKPKIVSVRGMLQPGALSQKPLKKKLFLHAVKRLLVFRKLEFHASTNEEKAHVVSRFGKEVKVHVAANFPRMSKAQAVEEKKAGQLNLVSIALISPMKNILLVLQALKKITAGINYHIYGPVKDHPYWQQCRRQIRSLPPNIRVSCHGDIHPSQVEKALGVGHVFILPSKSENFGHAIYEAMSAGKPVITSCHTPWNGLNRAKAGANVSVEGEADLAGAICFFAAMQAGEFQLWSDGARAYAEAAIDWEKIKTQYCEMFGLIQTKAGKKQCTQ